MNLLIIDTVTDVLKVGISINKKEYSKEIEKGFTHVENLLPAIESCLKEINEEKNRINYIGVCTGPGSFTGIRIGIAAALGISYALNVKCFGFSVFEVYKYLLKGKKDSIIIPIIDAKKERFYCSFMDYNETINMYDFSLDEIINKIKSFDYKNKKIIFAGKDFNLIKGKISMDFNFSEEFLNNYNGDDLLKFARELIRSSESLDEPKPIYLRKSEAELSLLKSKTIK